MTVFLYLPKVITRHSFVSQLEVIDSNVDCWGVPLYCCNKITRMSKNAVGYG